MLSLWPAGISTLYLVVVKLRMTCGRWPIRGIVQRLPPTKLTATGSGSSLLNERRAWVAWPLTSLMPNISDDGNCTDTFTFRVGEVVGFSTSSSG